MNHGDFIAAIFSIEATIGINDWLLMLTFV